MVAPEGKTAWKSSQGPNIAKFSSLPKVEMIFTGVLTWLYTNLKDSSEEKKPGKETISTLARRSRNKTTLHGSLSRDCDISVSNDKLIVGLKMKFADFICFKAIVPELKARDRNAAITELVKALQNAGKIKNDDVQKITRAVIKRENEASTGMGKGVAIPHVKHHTVKKLIAALGQSNTGIDFAALDKKPVYSIILLLSPPDEPDKHLQAMEKIFRHLQQEKFRKFLRQSQLAEQIEDLLKEADENPSLQ
jgi:mannitol/fructose-specific phosphotransferase system IIA component (Ntr-type)